MQVIAYASIRDFAAANTQARAPLEYWYDLTCAAEWKTMGEVKQTFGTADQINNSRVVFNIGGNNYRLIADIYFPHRVLFIKFIGTHREYDQVDAATVDLY